MYGIKKIRKLKFREIASKSLNVMTMKIVLTQQVDQGIRAILGIQTLIRRRSTYLCHHLATKQLRW